MSHYQVLHVMALKRYNPNVDDLGLCFFLLEPIKEMYVSQQRDATPFNSLAPGGFE